MIEIVESPYLGKKAAEQEKELVACLRGDRPVWDCFVLTLPERGGDLMEFTPSWVFLQPYFKRRRFRVFALARGKQEAIAVMTRIVEDCYQATGSLDVRSYLEGRGD